MNLERIRIYRDGLRVERLHTVPHNLHYSNGHHSANAALIGYELASYNDLSSHNIVLYLLMHDIHEGFIGDIPAPAKCHNAAMAGAVARMETMWEKENLPHLPKLCEAEREIIKAADTIELCLHCLDELKCGNKHVIPVIENARDYLEDFSDIIGVTSILSIAELHISYESI